MRYEYSGSGFTIEMIISYLGAYRDRDDINFVIL